MAYLDDLLGPFFPKRDTVRPTPRSDGAAECSTVQSQDDMATGSSQLGRQAVVPCKPPIPKPVDTKTTMGPA